MDSELRTVASLISKLPAGGGPIAPEKFFDVALALCQQLAELSTEQLFAADRSPALFGLLSAVGAHTSSAAALLQRLSVGSSAEEAARCALCLAGVARLAGGLLQGLSIIEILQQQCSSLGCSVELRAVLTCAARALDLLSQLLRSPLLEQHQALLLDNAGGLAIQAIGLLVGRFSMGAAYASAYSTIKEPLAALVRVLGLLAGQLKVPGEEGYSLPRWASLLPGLNGLLRAPVPEVARDMAAALCTAEPGAEAPPSEQLAKALLRLLAGLASQGPPQQERGSPERQAEVACWTLAAAVLLSDAVLPAACGALACFAAAHRQLQPLVALLGRLQQQAEAGSAAGALPGAEASELLALAMSAALAVSLVVQAHIETIDRQWSGTPLTPAQACQLVLLCTAASPFAAAALAAVQSAVAVLSATTAHIVSGAEPPPLGSHLAPMVVLTRHTGTLLAHLALLNVFPARQHQQRHTESTLAAVEAVLRCTGRLQAAACASASPPAHLQDLARSAAAAVEAGLWHCLRWALASRTALTPAEADVQLARLVAVASTVCKLALVHAATAEDQQQQHQRIQAAGRPAGPDLLLVETLLLKSLGHCADFAAVLARRGSGQAERLVQGISLLCADGAARLLPLTAPHVRAAWQQEHGSSGTLPLAQQQGEQAAASEAALAAARRCTNMGCIHLAGASDAQLRTQRCGRCRVARYCSEACSVADWRRHRRVCRPPARAE